MYGFIFYYPHHKTKKQTKQKQNKNRPKIETKQNKKQTITVYHLL